MQGTVKIWLITAALLIIFGVAIVVLTGCSANWNINRLGTRKYQTKTYDITEDFSSISINTDTADILFARSENESCKVVCFEEESLWHSVKVEDGKLIIDLVNEKKWYEYISIVSKETEITVYLPKAEYDALAIKGSTGDIEIPKDFSFESVDLSISTGDVEMLASVTALTKIKTSTGDIFVEDVSVGALDLAVSTGRVSATGVKCEGDIKISVSTGKSVLTDVTCKNLTSSGNTGGITLNNVIVAEKLSVERSTGDVRFDACDAAELFIKTDTGDVRGTLLTEKVFVTKTDTGKVSVPKSITGGLCDVETDTGNIILEIR